MVKEILRRDLDKEVSQKDLAKRALIEGLYRDLFKSLAKKPRTGILYKDLASRALMATLYKDIGQRSVAEILPRGLLHGSCQENAESWHRDFKERSCTETLHRHLWQRSCQ